MISNNLSCTNLYSDLSGKSKVAFKGDDKLSPEEKKLEEMKREEEFYKNSGKSPLNTLEILGMAALFFGAPYIFAMPENSKPDDLDKAGQEKNIMYSPAESQPESTIEYTI